MNADAASSPTSPSPETSHSGSGSVTVGGASPVTGETMRGARPVAVIDIGTSTIRMAIAEIDANESVRVLEKLTQVVNLGKDTFTRGTISKSTIEECVKVLRDYREVLETYQITRPEQLRVVATSAVREAENRLLFLDRIYSATGIDVEPIDEADVNRITYLSIHRVLRAESSPSDGLRAVVEIGGGSTELLLVEGDKVTFSQSFKLGSLRLRETLEAHRGPNIKLRKLMESQIDRIIEPILHHIPSVEKIDLIAMGGDVRFAAWQLVPEWDTTRLVRVPVAALEKLTDKLLVDNEDELVRKYHVSFPDAETLGPALLAYLQLARTLKLKHLSITAVNLRDGLLREMASQGRWTEDFRTQIIRSALDLGKKYEFTEQHAVHVADLSSKLFRAMRAEHRLDDRFELLLYIAALLHQVGQYISANSYHKHTLYIIRNSELFGLSRKDLLLVALIARYHRRASPKPTHEGYASLDREQRIAVSKLGAMLRVADALDRSHNQRFSEFECERDGDQFLISVPGVEDLSLEQLAIKEKGAHFEEIFGMKVLLQRLRR